LDEIFSGIRLPGTTENTIVWQIRLPRAFGCVLVGAILGMTGSAFQALFRNPLAEPYLVGVSGGAGVGGTLGVLLGLSGFGSGLGLLGMAMVGGVAAVLFVVALAGGRTEGYPVRLILAGVVVGTVLSAVMTLLLILGGQDTTQVLRWLLGSMSPMLWIENWVLLGLLGAGLAIFLAQARAMNVLAMDGFVAESLGVPVRRVSLLILVVGSVVVSAAVGAVGIIGFLGLVAPHVARRLFPIDQRFLIPASALIGSGLLLFADSVSQRLLPGGELPVGATTAILGAPVLLVLLRNQVRRSEI
jgi:iron complex transport system permease protein